MADRDPSAIREAAPLVPGAGAADTAMLNVLWSERFVRGLENAGIRDACLCPGSRSAPLVLALDRSGIRIHVALDERAGAYFALGLAKASRRPVAILTTSGTAAANLHPAVVEAYHSRVPLLVLTADRPPELRNTGAAQTIDQIQLFGTAVRWFHEVGTPASEPDSMRYVSALALRAARECMGPPAGPVHLNFAFREPLVPEPDAIATRAGADSADPGVPNLEEHAPIAVTPAPSDVARAARLLRSRRHGLLVCGPESDGSGFPEAIAKLAAVTGYPILADPASQVRYGSHDRSRVCGAYDLFLRSEAFARAQAPEVVLQFGAPLTSRAYHLYAARHPNQLHLLVDDGGVWRDPANRATERFVASAAPFAAALADALARGSDPLPRWNEAFRLAERAASEAIRAYREDRRTLCEGPLVADFLENAPENTIVYAGNSMIIRDLDGFAPGSARRVRVLANRGANGIDGIVSSGLGASAAGSGPALIITGDLSFHHDLNGLSALRDPNLAATIVVMNNDGGGIFSFLPIARHGAAFERYFGTPHGLEFSSAAALYGIPYACPSSPEEARSRVTDSLNHRERCIVEIRTDREENRASHQDAWNRAIRAVEAALA